MRLKAPCFMGIIACFMCVSVFAKNCEKYNDCVCIFDDDSGMIDLSTLSTGDGSALFLDHVSTSDSYWYSYNPCGAFTDGNCVNVAACQYDPYYYVFYDIGVPERVSFNYDGLNVVAKYESSDGTRKSFVTLVCDPGMTTPTIDVQGETAPTEYYFTLTSAAACAIPSAYSLGGISGGSVLLIIFFSFIFVYLIAGVTFQKVRRGAAGTELVPNKELWLSLPGLIKDGGKFSVDVILRITNRPGSRNSGLGAPNSRINYHSMKGGPGDLPRKI